MQAIQERKPKHSHSNQPVNAEAPCDNWLFICDRCGQPICYDEPLQVNCANGVPEVAHVRCAQG